MESNMNSVKNILILSLIVASMPLMAAPKKTAAPIATPTQQELNRQLIKAVETGNITEVKRLLSRGADANATSKKAIYPNDNRIYSRSALMAAAANGYAPICKLLLDHGAHVDTMWLEFPGRGFKYYENALTLAVMNNHLEACKILIAYGADVNEEFEYDGKIVTPLYFVDGGAPNSKEIHILLLAHRNDLWWRRASKKTKVALVLGAVATAAGIAYGAYKLYRHVTQSTQDRIRNALRSNQNLVAAVLRPGNGPENAIKIGQLMTDQQINGLINNRLLRPNGRRIGEQMTQEFISIINDPQFANNIEQEAFVANVRQQMLQRFEELS